MSEQMRKKAGGWGASGTAAGKARPGAGWLGQQPTQDLNVVQTISLVAPRVLVKEELPMTPAINRMVVESRETVRRIITGVDGRLLVVVGPCSIHDEKAALEYAERLHKLSLKLQDRLFIIMRVYFEKPRTTIGWKGLINDPRLDDTFDMDAGLHIARRLLLAISDMGLPTGTEMLDPITPQYIADLITWSAIGARTIESQTHREMASGLSMPIGYKNGTEGNLQTAIDAMRAAHHSHTFLGMDTDGRTAIIHTRGNAWGHIILRGGRSGPNYGPEKVAEAIAALRKVDLPPYIMVDCSHANSGKSFQNQEKVLKGVLQQRLEGNPALIGLLIESNLFEGSQPFQHDPAKLKYGVSITDECIGWEKTEELLHYTYDMLGRERT
jgi:3-deoxy-7-phosphoheptulonate synthase